MYIWNRSFDHDSVPVHLRSNLNLPYFKLPLDMKTTNYACWFNTNLQLSMLHTHINRLKIHTTKLITRCDAVGKLSPSTGELPGASIVGVQNALCGQGQTEFWAGINLTLRVWDTLWYLPKNCFGRGRIVILLFFGPHTIQNHNKSRHNTTQPKEKQRPQHNSSQHGTR